MARLDDVKLQQILDLLAELKSDFNALRTDFLCHDHGATASYAEKTIRFFAAASSVSTGSASATAIAGGQPATVAKAYEY